MNLQLKYAIRIAIVIVATYIVSAAYVKHSGQAPKRADWLSPAMIEVTLIQTTSFLLMAFLPAALISVFKGSTLVERLKNCLQLTTLFLVAIVLLCWLGGSREHPLDNEEYRRSKAETFAKAFGSLSPQAKPIGEPKTEPGKVITDQAQPVLRVSALKWVRRLGDMAWEGPRLEVTVSNQSDRVVTYFKTSVDFMKLSDQGVEILRDYHKLPPADKSADLFTRAKKLGKLEGAGVTNWLMGFPGGTCLPKPPPDELKKEVIALDGRSRVGQDTYSVNIPPSGTYTFSLALYDVELFFFRIHDVRTVANE